MHNEKVHKPAGLEKPISSRACSALPIGRSIGKVETQEKVVEHVRVNHDLCFVLRRSDMDVARSSCAADLFFPFLTPPRVHNGHGSACESNGVHSVSGEEMFFFYSATGVPDFYMSVFTSSCKEGHLTFKRDQKQWGNVSSRAKHTHLLYALNLSHHILPPRAGA